MRRSRLLASASAISCFSRASAKKRCQSMSAAASLPGAAAGVVSGYDAYADGHGAMEWMLLGRFPVMTADGPDVSTSAAGRAGGEAVWLPTALLPRAGVHWSAVADDHIVAGFRVGPTPIELHLRIDGDGHVRSVVFDRWGDPAQTGRFGWHPFGGEVTGQTLGLVGPDPADLHPGHLASLRCRRCCAGRRPRRR